MTDVSEIIKNNTGIIGAGVGGIALGGVLGYIASKSINKSSKRTPKRKYRTKNRKKNSKNNKRKRYTPYTAGKRKDTSHKRIRHTKNGQPYIILASGKAKFISKKSAKISRKRSGGRY